ncbi:glycoside hydrolase family 2 TIM barrel-domain containing protein [Paenibacillus sp. MMS20-IR301]|uniref:glycoside hydrolase family 2 TIM barrel-domain containing protein n=1 Tax=Paenibacillus sp. MMS20-IR301 TaxID=2895946 RepID=UPI0028E28062|nr:glycoside hydrolase family 2 TIM barrel-domain containing protein [Paenibacillus sp. MMS20-IR301]WNS44199.1 glycoside hydrolase family 2 TIM barrel-domain containing protein [Paenibacillus sp. MMS20-IR301]
MSRSKCFNNDWLFSKHPLHTDFESVITGKADWKSVTVPHDWLIGDSYHLYEDGDGWYRKAFVLPEQAPGTRLTLRFEGVYMDSAFYVNGHAAGVWKYGYSTFEIDITPFAKAGTNEIYVHVVHQSPNSRWYTGAGIYRSVWLKSYPDTHMAADGIYISTSHDNETWFVEASTEIVIGEQRRGASTSDLKLRYHVIDNDGKSVAVTEAALSGAKKNGSLMCAGTRIPIEKPELWDISRPYCYTLTVELIDGDAVIEAETQSFGFRMIKFDSRQGFFLNGRHVKLQGVCQHHDLGALGAAVNKTALRRQLVLLQEMGVNAIRTAHNMPAVELMELADELGLLIVSEAFDMWERSKTPYDYARFYPQWWKRDIASWVRRDRNRPSLIMWSIGNEIYDTHADSRGQELTRELMDEVLLHDPQRNAFVTIGSNFMPWENAQKCADIVKVAGYNYAEKYYGQHHEEHPDWIIYGSETCSTVQSRGVYHFPLAQSVLADDDQQCSSLGNSSTSWGAKSTEACITADRDASFSLGQFIWTGFDYIGEPTPYHTKNSYFGQLDTAGFPKDSYYIYQAEWTDYRTHPMIHIFPHWDFSPGQLIDVRVCSNAPRIELFLNDVSQGSVNIDHVNGHKLLGEWQLPYAEGVLRAVAYGEQGNVIATEQISSFGNAASLVLTPDKREMTADGTGLIFVTVSTLDQSGRPVANANNRIHLSVDGPGRLIGLDNGDSTDYDSYKGVSRRLFSGKLLAVIAGTLEAGTITLRAASAGVAAAEVQLQSVLPAPGTVPEDGLYLYAHNPQEADASAAGMPQPGEADDIPVRKLEIICPEGNVLTPGQPSLPVRVKLHPPDASWREVEWRITNAAGIDTNIAAMETDGHEAVITGLGDGDVYIRCGTANGADSIRLYSQMELKLTGFGRACLNPYEFVSSGYHSSRSTNLTNGNERGVATAREGESRICFERIDFGEYGADEIILPIFSLDDLEFPIEIWEGIPGDSTAALLTTVTYQKPSIWNVYQEACYRLPKRLTGITSLSFVLRKKIHLKGFSFVRKQKAFERLDAIANNAVYGDSFTVTGDAIEGIGNNVSLVYTGMDFGGAECSRIVICGRSALAGNTLQILFGGPDGESKQLIEFAGSGSYTEREFVLEPPVSGSRTVTFLFLPGSRFDFKWFRFLPSV